MKRTIVAGVTIFSVAVFGLPGFAVSSNNNSNVTHLSTVGGAIMLRHAGQNSWDSVASDSTLSPGDTIRTGSASAILSFDDSTVIRAAENSELRLVSSDKGQAHVALKKGRILSTSGSSTAVSIDTPSGGADGTDSTFSVSVDKGDNVRVKVLKGAAQVRGKNLQAPGIPGAPTSILTAVPTVEIVDQKKSANSKNPTAADKSVDVSTPAVTAAPPSQEVALAGSDVRRRSRTSPDEFTREKKKPIAPATPAPVVTPAPPVTEVPPPDLPPSAFTVAQDDAASFEPLGGTDVLPYVLGGLGLAGLIALLTIHGNGTNTTNASGGGGGGIPVSP